LCVASIEPQTETVDAARLAGRITTRIRPPVDTTRFSEVSEFRRRGLFEDENLTPVVRDVAICSIKMLVPALASSGVDELVAVPVVVVVE
jgi:hypothetical protein